MLSHKSSHLKGVTNDVSYETYKLGFGAAIGQVDAGTSFVEGSQNSSENYSGYSLTLSRKLPKGAVSALFDELSFEQGGSDQAYGVAAPVGSGTLQLSYLQIEWHNRWYRL